MRYWTHCGWLSTGEMPPDNIIIGMTDIIINSANWAIVRAIVPKWDADRCRRTNVDRRAQQQQGEIRRSARAARLHHQQQRKCECHHDRQAVGPDLCQRDFRALSGITSRCSMVPCSRSCNRCSSVRMIISIELVRQGHKRSLNQARVPLGLKARRLARVESRPAVALHLLAIACDFLGDDILNVAGADAGLLHRSRIGADSLSRRSFRPECRPRSGRISTMKVNWPLSIARSISAALMVWTFWKYGG